MNFVLHTEKRKFSKELIGGKAYGLHELQDLLKNVPPWGTLTTEFFDEVVKSSPELQALIESKNAQGIRQTLKTLSFSAVNLATLQKLWDKISKQGKVPVAVRSSAADEDGCTLSFAGQMDSFLQIASFEKYLQAIKDCWASLYGERAVAYREQHGINPWQAKIAVIIQQMIGAEVSGVLFTVSPIDQDHEKILVTTIPGLGEALVSGQTDADTYLLDREGILLEKETLSNSLNSQFFAPLIQNALKIEKKLGVPLDIEFSIAQNHIYFLQARPITSLKKCDQLSIWDNSNIVESYSGVTTPLTFSFIRSAYTAVYWQFCQTLGIPQKTIFKNRSVLQNMLGLIQGRVYYNLLNWYELISMMPGFSYNRQFMEQMMGLQVVKKSPFKTKKNRKELFRLLKVALRMTLAHLRLPKKIAQFHAHFSQIYANFSRQDFFAKTPTELLTIYRSLEEDILWKWRAPITNDFSAMIFYGLLKKLTSKWNVDPKGTLQNDLLCGEGEIKSTDLISSLVELARKIEKKQELKTPFMAATPEKAYRLLQSDPDCYQALQRYLDTYGVRCINEMKLESTPIKDDPLFCIATMQNYLRNGIPNLKEQAKREKEIRSQAEKALEAKLKGVRLFFYKWILKHTRRAIKNRENQRFARTQAYSLVRTLFQAIGSSWEQKGILQCKRDIFYLEMDEIWSFIEGTSTCTNLKELIQIRKNEFKAYEKENPDDRIETKEEVYFQNGFSSTSTETSEKVIKGLGCCSGVVEKPVQVVLTPDKNLKLNQEIMVAKQTDPGWGILFPSIGGLIVEKGSMLSHSAIVAREMGIPAVIGVKNATKIFKNGDRVRLDGTKGTIELL